MGSVHTQVAGRDYQFVNGDSYDYRYANILVINRFTGVLRHIVKGITKYRTMIHINGNYLVGTYSSEEKAAVAYNKAVDLAKAPESKRIFPKIMLIHSRQRNMQKFIRK